jgi:hypothetical protein
VLVPEGQCGVGGRVGCGGGIGGGRGGEHGDDGVGAAGGDAW